MLESGKFGSGSGGSSRGGEIKENQLTLHNKIMTKHVPSHAALLPGEICLHYQNNLS